MGQKTRRAVGIVRVSQVSGREGESFASPGEQADRIAAACERDGLTLVKTFEELDVSGGRTLEDRPGLSQAVAAIEAGEAEVIAAAYFDRLFRSLTTQAEVVERVEAAGGQVIAVDVGRVTGENAGQWLSGTMMGAVSEYYRRSIKERTGEAQRRAIARGVPPWADVTPGYRRTKDRSFEPDPTTAPIVHRAFEMRAEGKRIADVRAYLAEHGIVLSYHGTQTLLRSRVVLGEIHFGRYEPNLAAFPAIVERDLWARVQAHVATRGQRTPSDALLARLGVMYCSNCGRSMIAQFQTQQGRRYRFYRCGAVRQDCDRRAAISARIVEGQVVDAVRAALADDEGRASVEANVREAELAAERAQAALDNAILAFEGLAGETAAVKRLEELRTARDEARAVVAQLGGQGAAVTLNADTDWDTLTMDEQRAIIRLAVLRVTVTAGRGPDRVALELLV